MESNNLFVIHQPSRNGSANVPLATAVDTIGTSVRLFPGVWHVKTDSGALAAMKELARKVEPGDQLLIIDSTNDDYVCWPEQTDVDPFAPAS